MPLLYRDVLDILIQRALTLGLVDAESRQPDAGQLELYLFNALLAISESLDLNDFLVRDEHIAQTQPGKDTYALPEAYGRLIALRSQNRRGIFLNDTAKDYDLEYIDPNNFVRQANLVPARPVRFTVTRRQLLLSPPPDANGTNGYRIRGLYIERVARPGLDEPVPLSYPTAIIEEALYTLAGDMGKATQILQTRRTEALQRLASMPSG